MMSSKILRLTVAILLAGGMSAGFVAAQPASVGSLVQELAAIRGLPAGSPQIADQALRGSGVSLPNLSLDATLTEQSVVEISSAFGVTVRTSQPEAAFDADQMDRFLLTLGREFGRTPVDDGEAGATKKGDEKPDPGDRGADPLAKGKGKKKGLLKRSPVEPG